MKKTIVILISVFMLASLAGCGNSENEIVTEPVQTASETQSEIIPEDDVEEIEAELETDLEEVEAEETFSDTEETTAAAETEQETMSETTQAAAAATQDVTAVTTQVAMAVTVQVTTAATTQATTTANTQATEAAATTAAPQVQESKILVAYFSATNTTEGVAEQIANGLNADKYEIVPETPYTDADLNYNDDNSRTTIEMNDPDSRPAISGSVENMEQYDIVFIGYPIWWGEAPRIVSTFMESYDFSGKTIVPFCTSGGSGMGSSASNLEKLTSDAEWLKGKRLNGGDSQDTVMEWVNGLDLDIE